MIIVNKICNVKDNQSITKNWVKNKVGQCSDLKSAGNIALVPKIQKIM